MSSNPDGTSEKLLDRVLCDQGKMLLEQWEGWRGSNLAPHRSDFNVEDLGPLLPYIIELEFVTDENCTFRFIGSDLVEISGVDQTGANFFDAAPPKDRPLRIARCLELEKYPCGSLAQIPTTLNSGTTMMREALMLPVLPNRETGNFRLIIVSIPLENYRWQTPVREGSMLPLATSFHFIDIGAGVPAYNDLLRPNVTLTL